METKQSRIKIFDLLRLSRLALQYVKKERGDASKVFAVTVAGFIGQNEILETQDGSLLLLSPPLQTSKMRVCCARERTMRQGGPKQRTLIAGDRWSASRA
jgi:hypothetical protein